MELTVNDIKENVTVITTSTFLKSIFNCTF